MCGIVGVIKKANYGFYAKHQNSFFQMLYADAVRGWDSTGVVAVEKMGAFTIVKAAAEATFLIPQIKNEEFYTKHMDKADGKVWIGHNRKTTVGKTNDENAHPFVVNNEFAFVHNGTLFNHQALAQTDVDSKALAIVLHEALGKEKWKEALEETLGSVYGAYATAWFDQRHNKLFLLRNKERPLTIIETDDAYYWASETAMAYWVLTRNDYKHEEIKIHKLDEHVLASFDLKDTKLVMEGLKPKKASTPVQVVRTGGTHGSNTSTTGTKGKAGGPSPVMSKNELKRHRRTWMGHHLRFWVDDFVERDFAAGARLGDEGGVECYIMGETESIPQKNIIRAVINTKELNLNDETDIVDRMWMGVTEGIYYDDVSRQLVIFLNGCKPIANAALNLSKMSAGLERYLKEKQAEKEELHGPLTQVIKDGKVQLVCSTGKLKGEVVYETPIALH